MTYRDVWPQSSPQTSLALGQWALAEPFVPQQRLQSQWLLLPSLQALQHLQMHPLGLGEAMSQIAKGATIIVLHR